MPCLERLQTRHPCFLRSDGCYQSKYAAFVCLIHDDNNDDLMVLEDGFGLALPAPVAVAITNNNHVTPAVPRFTRSKFPRMKQYERSTWWTTRYLVPEARADLMDHPSGRLHKNIESSSIPHFLSFWSCLTFLISDGTPIGESTLFVLLGNLCHTLSC
jgi:hypothetical protein